MSRHTLGCARSLARNVTLSTALAVFGLSLITQGARAASDETVGDTFPVSLTAAGEFSETNTSPNPSISDDGRYVAFLSAAENLGGEGPPGVREAYVKDLHTGSLKLVSRAGRALGEPAGEPVENVILSGDGRFVIFASAASNLLEGPPVEGLHVYRRDLQTGETILVDRVNGVNGAIATSEATADAISDDGRYVVFSANVEDLEELGGSHSTTGSFTLYVRDLQTGTTTVAGRASGAAGAIADEPSFANSISPDGRHVAFESAARNLVPGMTANSVSQIYLRDLQTATTTLVSKTAPSEATLVGEPGNESSEAGTLVGTDGCRVTFDSEASDLFVFGGQPVSTPEVYLADICTTPASTTLVSRAAGQEGAPAGEGNGVSPRVSGASADGRYIVFSALAELTGETPERSTGLYLRYLDTGSTTLIDQASGTSGAPANANPSGSAISANGCRVAFATVATNLSEPEPPNGLREVYVRQLAACNEEPALSPAGLSFGVQALDTIGAGKLVTVTAGSEPLPIGHVLASGVDAGDFIVTADECSGETLQPAGLQPAGKCSLLVRFAPSAAGPRTAALVARGAAISGLEIALTGEGGQSPSGERGAQGGSGGPGAQGTAGRRGSVGQAGARGPAGRDAKVSCRLVSHRRRVACSVTFENKKAAGKASAKLTRDGHTYARGSLATLRGARAIRRGTYTLRLVLDGRSLSVPVRLR
jgi:hypothetical protein